MISRDVIRENLIVSFGVFGVPECLCVVDVVVFVAVCVMSRILPELERVQSSWIVIGQIWRMQKACAIPTLFLYQLSAFLSFFLSNRARPLPLFLTSSEASLSNMDHPGHLDSLSLIQSSFALILP